MKKTIILVIISLALIHSAEARERSEKAKDAFKYSHPCPSNGNNHGSCPGYVIDHIKALACGGADSPENMKWQTIEEGKAKDKWERIGCDSGKKSTNNNVDKIYHIGSRGGCFTYSKSGNKKYVDHSFCKFRIID